MHYKIPEGYCKNNPPPLPRKPFEKKAAKILRDESGLKYQTALHYIRRYFWEGDFVREDGGWAGNHITLFAMTYRHFDAEIKGRVARNRAQ